MFQPAVELVTFSMTAWRSNEARQRRRLRSDLMVRPPIIRGVALSTKRYSHPTASPASTSREVGFSAMQTTVISSSTTR